MKSASKRRKKRKLSREDLQFFERTALFNAVPEEGKTHFLACLAPETIRAGVRFIRQGEEADCLYLIQEGSCRVLVEKDGVTTPVIVRKFGELIGEMSILTGERRTAHVHAETDMSVWRMSRVEFDELCLAYPSICEFVTELITKRISQSKFTPHRTIGKYVITDVIDEGGWGVVYKGVHQSLNLPVAIKMLKHAMAMDTDFTNRFENEAHVIARLNHPNIVRVYDIEHLYRTIFIVMEYLAGQSLRDLLAGVSRLPFPRAMNLLIQVAEGLEYAHQKGIVHKDIKPDNIFVRDRDRVRIVDFGLACSAGMEDDPDFAGTPYYMSPEQIEGDPVDERTDIYSLGITAFEMFTGRKPFPGPNVADILKAHRELAVPDPSSVNPDLPAEVSGFIQKATQKDPAKRHQTMAEALEHLKPLAGNYQVTQTVEADSSSDTMILRMTCRDVDQLELARLVEEFAERLKELGVELSVDSIKEARMKTIRPGDQVVSMAPNGETIEVYSVVKVVGDEAQVDGASGKLSKAALRLYDEDIVNRIREREDQIKTIKQEIRSLYNTLAETA
jgi:serine/threonine protein kinase